MRPNDGQKRCDAWNKDFPVGTEVIVRKDSGETHRGKTTSEAYMLSGHTPVIHVSGISGCYLLNRVEAANGQ